MASIDLNSDVGEGSAADAEILDCVTSANVACGVHAGDPETMRATVELAFARGVAIGAHPGLPDREGFGRRTFAVTAGEARELVKRQVSALAEVASSCGTALSHVKPHGALYNLAATDAEIAEAVAGAVHDLDPELVLFGLSGGLLLNAALRVGLKAASEVFADRGYRPDRTLVPRSGPGAVVTDRAEVVSRALRMAREGRVATVAGGDVEVRAETICLHGDTPGAADLARDLRRALVADGFTLRAPSAG